MSGKEPEPKLSNAAIICSLAFLACCFMFIYLDYVAVSRTGLMVPVILGWVVALIAMHSLVDQDKQTALYFAFGILAIMIYFVYETYGYTSRVHKFPLIVGYTGIIICVLNVLSLSNRAIGTTIAQFFGDHLDHKEMGGRKAKRELITFAAMGGCVLGLWLFGFLAFSPIFVTLWMLAGRKTVKNALYGGTFTILFIYLMFEVAFKYELYRGILFIWLFDL
ncbi:hypothetical protein OAJ57_00955 [Alphaproteobacteria bacterium]|nr:hypothetical protein [Alphaproteobacteria bacterium]